MAPPILDHSLLGKKYNFTSTKRARLVPGIEPNFCSNLVGEGFLLIIPTLAKHYSETIQETTDT